ncbi:MAG TPA: amidohydrolase family protein [Candidatus Acidoferrales bacterium]|nr:amidohydrolase family protein [Candidatus Acidoferrales bacterium]
MKNAPYQRIATEEAYAPPELFVRYRALLESGSHNDPGFASLMGFYLNNTGPRLVEVRERMQDIGERRIRDMDDTGIAKQILSLTSPGVQIFDAPTAVALATSFNDQLAEAIRRHPDRFAGLAAIAPQDPPAAAKELERAVKSLGLKGAIINSHTRGEYLDETKYWAIFEAAESLGVPIYLHPTTPSPRMIGPFLDRGLDGAVFGFAVETSLHILRIVVSGVFDRFPKLQMVAGHLGEGLPYWLFRIDFMHQRLTANNRYANVKKLQRKPSDYLKGNFYVTTSGMAWQPPILYAQSVLGVDRVLYAMDYPYQFVPEEVRVTDELPISDADKKKLYQTNAESVFRV